MSTLLHPCMCASGEMQDSVRTMGFPWGLQDGMVLSPWWQEGCLATLLRKDVTSVTTLFHSNCDNVLQKIMFLQVSWLSERHKSVLWWEETESPQGLHHLWQVWPAREDTFSQHQECHTQGGACNTEEGGGWGEKPAQTHWKTGFCSSSVGAS